MQSCVCASFRTESVHMYTGFKCLLMALIIKFFHFGKGLSKIVNSAITHVSSSPRQSPCQLCYAIPVILLKTIVSLIQQRKNPQNSLIKLMENLTLNYSTPARMQEK